MREIQFIESPATRSRFASGDPSAERWERKGCAKYLRRQNPRNLRTIGDICVQYYVDVPRVGEAPKGVSRLREGFKVYTIIQNFSKKGMALTMELSEMRPEYSVR